MTRKIAYKTALDDAFVKEVDRALEIIFSVVSNDLNKDYAPEKNHRVFPLFWRLTSAYQGTQPSTDWVNGFFDAVMLDDDRDVKAVFRIIKCYVEYETRQLDWVQYELTKIIGKLAREGRKTTAKGKTLSAAA